MKETCGYLVLQVKVICVVTDVCSTTNFIQAIFQVMDMGWVENKYETYAYSRTLFLSRGISLKNNLL